MQTMMMRVAQTMAASMLALPALPVARASPAAGQISVVSDIPGRAASAHFAMSAMPAADESAAAGWQKAFVLETTAKEAAGGESAVNQGYFSHLNGFTNSWASVMLGPGSTSGGALLHLSRLSGGPIKTAAIHPARSGATVVSIAGSSVTVRAPKAAQFTVMLDGGLDDVDTGPSFKVNRTNAIHTFTALVRPYLEPPLAGAPGVQSSPPAGPSPRRQTTPQARTRCCSGRGSTGSPPGRDCGQCTHSRLLSGCTYRQTPSSISR